MFEVGGAMEAVEDRWPETFYPEKFRMENFPILPCKSDCCDEAVREGLIRSSHLAFAHIVQNTVRKPRIVSLSSDGILREDTLPPFRALFDASPLKAQFLAACNGMVLACTGYPPPPPAPIARRRPRVGFPDPSTTVLYMEEYVLLNPVTGTTSTIPPPPGSYINSFFNFLVFDPRTSINHFSVVAMDSAVRKSEAFLFSSHTGEWRKLDASPPTLPQPQYEIFKRDDCCCVDGIGYKIAGYSASALPSKKNTQECLFSVTIMAFDVLNECLFWLTSPVVTKDSLCSGNYFIGESAGRLTFAYLDPRRSLSLWMLHDPRLGKWGFTHNVNLNDAPVSLPEGMLYSFAFHPLEADLMFVSCSGRLLLVNVKTLVYRELLSDDEFLPGSLHPYLCPEKGSEF